MAFLDDIGKKISNASQSAVQKTKDITDIARCNSIISDEEKKIQNLYMQIGKLYATMHRTDCEKDFAGMISSISESEKKIAELKTQIQTIKGITLCEKCGAEVADNAAFCSACGTPMPKADVAASNEPMINCPNCGQLISSELRFCLYCGKPVAANNVVAEPIVEETVNMINCKNCGQSISAELKFCLYCGKPLEEEADASTPVPVAAPIPVVAPVPVVPVAPVVAPTPITVINENVQAAPTEEAQTEETVSVEATTYCTGCGAALEPECRFCINCGKPVEEAPTPTEPTPVVDPVPVIESTPTVEVVEEIQTAPVEEPKTEETTSVEATIYCTGCGAVLEPENRFCINCGKPVEEAPTPTEPTPVVIPVAEPTPIVESAPVIQPPTEEPKAEENKCTNCGNAIAEGVKFCIYCGTPVAAPVSQPVVIPALKKCPNCGNEYMPDMMFCTECGTKL